MNHIISGGNFHGEFRIVLRGPAGGFVLSKSQERKLDRALCGISDCKCGGGYGRGADWDSAETEMSDDGGLRLVPALDIAARAAREEELQRAAI